MEGGMGGDRPGILIVSMFLHTAGTYSMYVYYYLYCLFSGYSILHRMYV